MKKSIFTLVMIMISSYSFAQWKQYNPNPNNDPALASKELLNPTNHVLIMIDHESQMAFAVESQPIIRTTVAEKSFSGPVFPEIKEYYPDDKEYIDRTTMNSWEDVRLVKAVEDKVKKIKEDKPKLVMAGLWTEVCILTASLSALDDGYDVYVITDASGGISQEAHDMSIMRMVQAGVKPMTSLQYLLEVYRDWARSNEYVEVNNIAKKYGGAYGLGIDYIKTMTDWIKAGEGH